MEGLFRKCGNCGRQRTLREKLNGSENLEKLLSTETFNVHDCASVLKSFLAELPEPLLTDRHFTIYCMAAGRYFELPVFFTFSVNILLFLYLDAANRFLAASAGIWQSDYRRVGGWVGGRKRR